LAKSDIFPVREIEYRCSKCGRVETRPMNFFKTYSPIFENNGFMPICKDCLAKLYNKYLLSFHDIHKAIKRICMAMDLYYNESIVDSCIKKSQASTPPIGEYIKKLNLSGYKGKTFDNSIDECFLFDLREDESLEKDLETKPISTIPDSVRGRWGYGFSDEDYKALEEHYRYLKKSNPDFDSNQEIFIMDLCQTKMQQTRAMMSGRTDDYIKLTESYRKSFAQAGLKTVRESTNEDDFSLGVNAQIIEQYTPAEYYKNKERYKDHDGLGDYFQRFLVRPLKNLMTGSSERDYEYYVKDEEDIVDDE